MERLLPALPVVAVPLGMLYAWTRIAPQLVEIRPEDVEDYRHCSINVCMADQVRWLAHRDSEEPEEKPAEGSTTDGSRATIPGSRQSEPK